MDNLTEQELKAVFDVLNVYDPDDIKQVYPEMGDDEFMQDVYSAWNKILKLLKQDKLKHYLSKKTSNPTISWYYRGGVDWRLKHSTSTTYGTAAGPEFP